jgi:hypothetical protein
VELRFSLVPFLPDGPDRGDCRTTTGGGGGQPWAAGQWLMMGVVYFCDDSKGASRRLLHTCLRFAPVDSVGGGELEQPPHGRPTETARANCARLIPEWVADIRERRRFFDYPAPSLPGPDDENGDQEDRSPVPLGRDFAGRPAAAGGPGDSGDSGGGGGGGGGLAVHSVMLGCGLIDEVDPFHTGTSDRPEMGMGEDFDPSGPMFYSPVYTALKAALGDGCRITRAGPNSQDAALPRWATTTAAVAAADGGAAGRNPVVSYARNETAHGGAGGGAPTSPTPAEQMERMLGEMGMGDSSPMADMMRRSGPPRGGQAP